MGSRDGITAIISVFLIRSSTTTLSPSTQGHSRKAADSKWGSRPSPDPNHAGTDLQNSSLQNCLSTPRKLRYFIMQPKLTQTPKLPLSEMGLCCHQQLPHCPQCQQALPLSNTPARTGRLLFVSQRRRLWPTRLFLLVKLRTQVFQYDGSYKPSPH